MAENTSVELKILTNVLEHPAVAQAVAEGRLEITYSDNSSVNRDDEDFTDRDVKKPVNAAADLTVVTERLDLTRDVLDRVEGERDGALSKIQRMEAQVASADPEAIMRRLGELAEAVAASRRPPRSCRICALVACGLAYALGVYHTEVWALVSGWMR